MHGARGPQLMRVHGARGAALGMPRCTGRRWHRAGGPEVTAVPRGAADGVASPGLRRELPAGAAAASAVRAAEEQRGRQPGATGSATRRAGPGLTGRPRGGPSSRAAAALDRGELGGAGVAPPGCRRGPGGPGAAPVWPRYLPAPRRSPAPSWSGGGSGTARGRPPPATGPQRGRGGGGFGGGGVARVQLGARQSGTTTDRAGTARRPPLPCSGFRCGRGGHDPRPMTGLRQAGLTAAPATLT